MPVVKKLIFVYNTNKIVVSGIFEGFQKLLKPQNQFCHLRSLTYGIFSEKRLCKKFRKSNGIEFQFLHKNQFLKQYRSKWLPKYQFPVVLMASESGLEIFLGENEIKQCENLSDLIDTIQERLTLY